MREMILASTASDWIRTLVKFHTNCEIRTQKVPLSPLFGNGILKTNTHNIYDYHAFLLNIPLQMVLLFQHSTISLKNTKSLEWLSDSDSFLWWKTPISSSASKTVVFSSFVKQLQISHEMSITELLVSFIVIKIR